MSPLDWTDPAAIGYPVLFGGVLLGSIVPVVPTGAIVGAAAAVATTTDHLDLVLVVLLATVAALIGDLVTFAAGRGGRGPMTRWFARRQSEERLAAARVRFTKRGWQLVVIGRLVPAGRIPVLLAAGALDYPWRRLVPAATGACLLWAVAYAALGVLSGGLFDNPIIATLIAALLVLAVTLLTTWLSRRREQRRNAAEAGQRLSEACGANGQGWASSTVTSGERDANQPQVRDRAERSLPNATNTCESRGGGSDRREADQ